MRRAVVLSTSNHTSSKTRLNIHPYHSYPMRHRLFFYLLVSCLGLSLSLPNLRAQGGGASLGGGANQVEGTGKGACGPGDGTGPGQGAGQSFGPGVKTPKERLSKDKPDAHSTSAREEKPDRNHPEGKKEGLNEQGPHGKAPHGKQLPADNSKQQDDPSKTPKNHDSPSNPGTSKRPGSRNDRNPADKESLSKKETDGAPISRNEESPSSHPKQPSPPANHALPSSPAGPSSKPAGGEDRPPPVKPTPQPKPKSAKTPSTPGQAKGSPIPPLSPINERSLFPGSPSSLIPSAPKPTSLVSGIPSGGTLPSLPRVDSPASVSETIVALPGLLVDRIFGGHKKRVPPEKLVRNFSSGKEVLAAEKPFRTRKRGGGFLFGIIKPEFPNLWKAAKVQRVVIDHRVTSPRTITYKSRFSRVSRWIAPLTLGLATYIPYETMNASVAARINNLMAEEEIYVEKEVSAGFAAEISKSKRFRVANPPEAVFELEITRYALDPMPLSIGRMKPTVSVTGRLFDTNGQLLWIGKGFSTILERGIRGATVEQYEDDPELLLNDFRASVSSAIRRLGAMANVVPRASVTVTPVKEKP